MGQLAAYAALGAQVLPVAISSDPGFSPEWRRVWRSFVESTPELDERPRFFGGTSLRALFSPRFLRDVLWPYLHGDQAVIRVGFSQRAILTDGLAGRSFDLVHCNHFFLMPVARKLSRGLAPILLDTHDLQARQFALMNERMPWLSPRVGYRAMLEQELQQMRGADLLIHLNAAEESEFLELLPEKRHALLYPAVPAAPTGPGGSDVVLVASNNPANVESVIWFLREVAPLASGVAVKIVGNVDAGVRAAAPREHERFKSWFVGRVDDPGAVYASARLVLLPTISGHGLSIKTVEAMASGLPLIATRLALRGMTSDALALPGVTIAEDANNFARALRDAASSDHIPDEKERRNSPVRAYYDAHFSARAYASNLTALTAPLLAEPARC